MSEQIDLDELTQLARKAETPSPWEVSQWGYGEPYMVRHDSEAVIYLGADVIAEFNKGDAEFIAAANPRVVLALIAELRALRNAIENVDAALRSDDRSSMRVIVAQETITRFKQREV